MRAVREYARQGFKEGRWNDHAKSKIYHEGRSDHGKYSNISSPESNQTVFTSNQTSLSANNVLVKSVKLSVFLHSLISQNRWLFWNIQKCLFSLTSVYFALLIKHLFLLTILNDNFVIHFLSSYLCVMVQNTYVWHYDRTNCQEENFDTKFWRWIKIHSFISTDGDNLFNLLTSISCLQMLKIKFCNLYTNFQLTRS